MRYALKKIFRASFAKYNPVATVALNVLGGAGAPLQRSTLPFTMQQQLQTDWCWAATSTSVSLFYDSTSLWTQCTVASASLGNPNCCSGVIPNPCNQTNTLDGPLTTTGNFNPPLHGVIAFADAQNQINAGNVIGVRIVWGTNGTGGAHFMCIYGFSVNNGINYYNIDDPIYGKTVYSEYNFTNAYRTNGHWTTSYYTQG